MTLGTRTHSATLEARRPALHSLTGMRFVAAVMVFISHLFFVLVPSSFKWNGHTLKDFWGDFGGAGVSFFFILSGFVLTWSAVPGEPARAFWRRRVFKVVPNHLLTAVAAMLLLLSIGGTLTARQVVPNLLLVQSWVPDYAVLTGLNDVSWSLAAEAFFYLCFPFFLRLISKLRTRGLWWGALAAVAGVWCVPLIAELFIGGAKLMYLPWTVEQLWFVYFFPATRCLEFLLGMVLARLVMEGRWPRIGLVPAALLFVPCYIGALYIHGQYGLVAATVVPLALIVPAAATADLGGVGTPLAGRAMVWLGEVSFAFYMVHELVIIYGAHALGVTPMSHLSGWEITGLALLAFTVALALAVLLYTALERPVMRRWSRPRRTEAPPPAVPVGV